MPEPQDMSCFLLKLKNCLALLLLAALALSLSSCIRAPEDAVEQAEQSQLAMVNEESLYLADFEYSGAWLPDFVRQLEGSEGLNIHRFSALIQLMLMAQDAAAKQLMTPAERSLAIKEALAEFYLEAQAPTQVDLSPERIDDLLAADADSFLEPARYELSYALVHHAERRQILKLGLVFSHAAQLGYNVYQAPPLEQTAYLVGHPLMSNQGGHPMSGRFFAYGFAARFNERANDPSRLGPFSERDGMIFSCPQAIAAIEKTELGQIVEPDPSCDPLWQAFAVLESKIPAHMPDDETVKLLARQRLIDEAKRSARTALRAAATGKTQD